MSVHASAWDIARGVATAFRPPVRVSVSEGAAAALVIRQPGGYSGPWSADETPYMTDPMDRLASRRHEAVCFVGPARTGKTMGLLDGWFAHVITADPGDMLVVQMTQDKARDYSKTRISRAIAHSDRIRNLLAVHSHADNTHDKMFRHGAWLKIGWPSASQLSGSDYRYVALTDYDRMPDDIDGEGAAFGLALKRTQTFLSRGMCMVESSPGREITDPRWIPSTAHEAPPCGGILGIYNRSDRRRWHWPCPDCGGFFEARPGLSLFSTLPPEAELLEIVRTADLPALADHHARIVCPLCGSVLDASHKFGMNRRGLWLAEGQTITAQGVIEGEATRSTIAGYWLGGVAAAYQSWHSLVLRYLQGLREYAISGMETALQNTVNTDQGCPYLPRHLAEAATANPLARAEPLERFHVPAAARFLVASVDVQGGTKGRFVVQVHAIGPGLEQWVVDRYSITHSLRGSDTQIDPAAYAEDWDVLTAKVINATYRIEGGRELRVLMTAVDSGGEAGSTPNAYAWFRRVKKAGYADRVMLVKGGSQKPESPVVKANARDARGKPLKDVALYILDTDYFKDAVAATLRRADPGPGYMHFAEWLSASWYDELNAEIKEGGKWKKIRTRNEALDLWVYVLAVCYRIGAHKLNWDAPPAWAAPLDRNINVVSPDDRRAAQFGAAGGSISLAGWARG